MNLKTNSLYGCENHIDIIIDEFINNNMTFPEITFNEEEKCSYCNKQSKYEIRQQILK